ncbi:Ig-like domain-containing protein [Kitasatospora sp. NPDC004615]|uniref:phage tail tube protein n=1 Tax=Kitasatospora sp. NPDC004615 TaxID=3364017 RepID=UPI0036BE878F
MAGDTSNARLWANADVWIAPIGTARPADANSAFGAGWSLVGLLDGDDGMPETRDEDTNDKFAWGGDIVRSSRTHFKFTKKFSVLEDNPTTRSLIWPGSTASRIVVPKPVPLLVAFETRDPEAGIVYRKITAGHAIVTVDGDVDQNETDLQKVVLAAVVYPDTSTSPATLFIPQTSLAVTSLVIAPATKALTAGQIGALTATATLSDNSTRDVTLHPSTAWSTSATAKATVQYGYVTGVAAGTATITATYMGASGTCAVTVS